MHSLFCAGERAEDGGYPVFVWRAVPEMNMMMGSKSGESPRVATLVLGLFQQGEVLVAGDARGAQIVQDDKHRYGFLPNQHESGELKDATEALVRNRRNAGHEERTALEGQLHMLGRDEGRGAPVRAGRITGDETLFTEGLLQRSHALALFEEQPDRFHQPATSLVNGVAAAGHSKLRTIADKRLTFLEDQRGKLNLMHSIVSIAYPMRPSQCSVPG